MFWFEQLVRTYMYKFMRVLIYCKIQKIHVIDTINSIYENKIYGKNAKALNV